LKEIIQTDIPVKVTDYISLSTKLLREKNILDARLNAELMLCDVLKCNRIKLYLDFEKPLSKEEVKIFKDYIKRRLKNEPLQYILGRAPFYGMDFIVNKKVFIPRQETELLVERVLEDISLLGRERISIFEIGTGSGCISISIAKNLVKEKIDFEIFSIDNSQGAIEVALENLKLNMPDQKNIKFYMKDVFEINKLNKSFDYIISNPPYISYVDYEKLEPEVKNFEPEASLTDKEQGLKFYKKIFEIASNEVFKGKIYCEIGFGQENGIKEVLLLNNFKDFSFYRDYNGIKRILEVKK